MIIFWTIAKSAVFPIIVFQRTRDTHNVYCMYGHLLKLKYKYFKILIFDFHELQALIIKIKTNKKTFEIYVLWKFHFLK